MKNKLTDLNDVLFEQIERLNDEDLSIRAAAPRNGAQRLPRPHGTQGSRTYRRKPCRGCTNEFQPTGPRDTFCLSCKGKKR